MSFESIVYNNIIGCHNCRGKVNYEVHDPSDPKQLLKYVRPNQTKYELFEKEQKFLEENYIFNDLKLYEVAVQKFNDRIAEFGLENMKKEVEQYKKVEEDLASRNEMFRLGKRKRRKKRSAEAKAGPKPSASPNPNPIANKRFVAAVPIKSSHKGDMIGLKNYMVENYAYCSAYDVIFENF